MEKKIINISRSDFAEKFLYLKGKPFSLTDYPHMRDIYNSEAKEIVMKFSRQCVYENQEISLANGKQVKAKDIVPGMKLIGFNPETLKNEIVTVTNVWDNGIEDIYRIQTYTKRAINVTGNHPIWTINGFVEAQNLKYKDRIGISQNNNCAFQLSEDCPYNLPEIRTIAFLLALHKGKNWTFQNDQLFKSFYNANLPISKIKQLTDNFQQHPDF